jgi:formamidopyrimidine-DNA glycosylase
VPELHDVEHFRRFFQAHAKGRRIERVVVRDPEMVRNTTPEQLEAALVGRVFAAPERHGKWLFCWTDDGPGLVLHFGMTGLLAWSEDVHRHDRLILELEGGTLHYRNMRRFGGIWLAENREAVGEITGELGPDALRITRRDFHHLLFHKKGAIKALLMDQTVLAGIGNIISDEVLWQAQIHPLRALEELTGGDRDRLFEAMQRVLGQWVQYYGVDRPRWLTHVRGKAGVPCPRCHEPLVTVRIAGRTSYVCPACQPAPGAVETSAAHRTPRATPRTHRAAPSGTRAVHGHARPAATPGPRRPADRTRSG